MRELDTILEKAAGAVNDDYFLLPIDGGRPIYRERVYCYELYHQMRTRWPEPEESPFRLNGEVDKRAHALLELLGIKGEKPDFLVHQPGRMDGNYAVIEVKPPTLSPEGIQKDLTTLALFRGRAGYFRGIYLIYGREKGDAAIERVSKVAQTVEGANGIEIWLHPKPGVPAALAAIV